MWGRVFRGLIGYFVAAMAAALVFMFFVLPAEQVADIPVDLFADRMGRSGAFWLAASAMFLAFAAPFALIAAVLGEMKSYRSWLYYALCGAAIAVLGYLIWQESRPASPSEDLNLLGYGAFAVAGLVGGLVYWAIAGSKAGTAPIAMSKPKAPMSKPLTATGGSMAGKPPMKTTANGPSVSKPKASA